MGFLLTVINIYLIICVVRVAFTWLNLDEGSSILTSIATISYACTEPVFATVRRRLPQIGDLPIDFSPAIVIVGLGLLRQILQSI